MNSHPPVLFFSTHSSLDACLARHAGRAARLEDHGFIIEHCGDLHSLYASARRTGVNMAMLDGSLADNCLAAGCLRRLHPQIRILALLDTLDEQAVMRALQSGADIYASRHASAELLGTILLALWRQFDTAEHKKRPWTAGEPPVWALKDQAWILACPAGEEVLLTTGERAFLSALFRAPGMRAERADLLQAVDASYSDGAALRSSARLGVLVSRLRRKFQDRGLALPLKSVHGRGYMFTGEAAGAPDY